MHAATNPKCSRFFLSFCNFNCLWNKSSVKLKIKYFFETPLSLAFIILKKKLLSIVLQLVFYYLHYSPKSFATIHFSILYFNTNTFQICLLSIFDLIFHRHVTLYLTLQFFKARNATDQTKNLLEMFQKTNKEK